MHTVKSVQLHRRDLIEQLLLIDKSANLNLKMSPYNVHQCFHSVAEIKIHLFIFF